MKKLLSIFSVFVISCGTIATPIDSTVTKIYDSPARGGAFKDAEVGNSVLIKGLKKYEKTVVLQEKYKTITTKITLMVGDVFVLEMQNDNYLYYTDKYKKLKKDPYCIVKNKQTNVYYVGNRRSHNSFWILEDSPIQVKESQIVHVNCNECYNKELVYNGKTGSTINFMYREYDGNYARPSFFQNVQYDLNDSNIIGLKGARIDVKEATNTSITYKVLKGFD